MEWKRLNCSEYEERPWRALEFYSGIGGMRYSLIEAAVNAVVVEAFDINDVANDVYEHNFRHRPHQGNIQTLSAADLDGHRADAWLLSPPCQPYTRQGLQKGSKDARAASFLKILELIPDVAMPPLFLFVENVVGFEKSDTHDKMMEILEKHEFVTQEFILSPLQFGIPYSRPRYYCLAKRKPLTFRSTKHDNQLLWNPGAFLWQDENTTFNDDDQSQEYWEELLQHCQPIENFLEWKSSANECKSKLFCSLAANNSENADSDDADNGLDSDFSNEYVVPTSLVDRWGDAMDIVFPYSKRCCCFTKSYYRYVKGTGSLLATKQGNIKNKASLKDLCLRYFTPREVANLHSFPADFKFPQHVSLRQRYALFGNSLSVGVVAPLLRYLFTEAPTPMTH
ncbi:hypothetical protein DM860_015619 [Cuscuta australis]|uniref:DNA (cytosine-5-)-methyltransferase n=1 Tax=Cuscuta australis TaxID=267555 RepID=A0A328DIY0_9ASTE|nr:hypothetical protein DM860_015619 [Cuscuta australis]